MDDKTRAEREQELYLKCRGQGHSSYRAHVLAERQYVSEYVSDMVKNRPEELALLRQKVACEAQKGIERAEEARRLEDVRRRCAMTYEGRARQALICEGLVLPPISRSDFVAFRSWDVSEGGRLHGVGVGSGYEWCEVNISDIVPTEWNQSGLHAYRVDPECLIVGGVGGHIGSKCCGLVALGGDVVEHADGVFRAEYARLLCLWYVMAGADAYSDVPSLQEHYPTTPLFVCTRRQVTEALFVVAAARVARGEGFVESFGMEGQW